jgi:hypothetical protein
MRHHERVGVITGYMDLGEGTNHKRVEYMSRAYMNLSPTGTGAGGCPCAPDGLLATQPNVSTAFV